MRYYAYFPGCSTSEGGAKAYNLSAQAVGKALGVELIELEDWNCCGSTPYSSFEELASFCLSARNLAMAEKTGFDLVTPCSSCYVILNRTNSYLKQYLALYTNRANDVVMRTAPAPQGPWGPEQTLVSSVFTPGGVYAPFLHPWSTGRELYYNVSLWSAYNVMLMRTVLP